MQRGRSLQKRGGSGCDVVLYRRKPVLRMTAAALSALLLALLLFSCTARGAAEGDKQNAAQNAGGGKGADAGAANVVRFTDDEGVELELTVPRTRIIALYSAHTENLFWIGAGKAVIGGHKTCVWPPEAAPLAVFDYTGDPEYVIAAEPDLVLTVPRVHRLAPDYVAEIRKAGIPVVSLYADRFEDFDEYIMRLALLCGVDASGNLAEFHRGIENIRRKTAAVPPEKRPRVFFEATENNLRTVSPDSFPARAIEFAGARNVAEGAKPVTQGSSIAPFGLERLLEKAADIDVYAAQNGAMNPATIDSIQKRPGFMAIKAVSEGRILIIDEKLISAPTSRFLEGVSELARFVYPALDWDE